MAVARIEPVPESCPLPSGRQEENPEPEFAENNGIHGDIRLVHSDRGDRTVVEMNGTPDHAIFPRSTRSMSNSCPGSTRSMRRHSAGRGNREKER